MTDPTFPLGTLYAGVPFLFERRVRPHPPTATAGEFSAIIVWNWFGHDDASVSHDVTVVDSTYWLPHAPENMVVLGWHAYAKPGAKKIYYEILPHNRELACPYYFTFGSINVLPSPGMGAVIDGWNKFMSSITKLNASARNAASKYATSTILLH